MSAVTPTAFVPEKAFMQQAIDEARAFIQQLEGGPFGACIVRGDRVLAVAHNSVLLNTDATCHAEINAIRAVSRQLQTFDLSDCVIYSTTEPCPMCFSAIHWARIGRIVYGTNIDDVKALGFNELSISNQHMKRAGHSQVEVYADFMRDECLAVLREWAALPSATPY